MEITFLLQLILTFSFLLVSLAFAIKLIAEAYISWVEFKTGLQIAIQQILEDEEDIDG
jgi:hypothetical protein